jgi:thiosulfate dehydrogenase [quinone] large subunit
MEVILMIKKDEIAYLLLRLTLGANIFLHGFSRLIGDHAAFAAYMDKQMHNAPLPGFLVHFVGVVLPWCEGTVGLLMILGLWTSLALIAGSLLMLTLQIGTCLAQNWDVAGASTHLRAFVLYLADVLREESLVGGSVVGNASTRSGTRGQARRGSIVCCPLFRVASARQA